MQSDNQFVAGLTYQGAVRTDLPPKKKPYRRVKEMSGSLVTYHLSIRRTAFVFEHLFPKLEWSTIVSIRVTTAFPSKGAGRARGAEKFTYHGAAQRRQTQACANQCHRRR